MRSKKPLVHVRQGRSSKSRIISRKRAPSPVKLHAVIDPSLQHDRPTLVFKRRWPSNTWMVPPMRVPVYWFDQMMVDKKMITPIPPDTFLVDGRRFKVLAQDRNTVGRFSYTRWLVYEQAAVPKGERP